MHRKHEAGSRLITRPAPVAVMWCDAPENAPTQREIQARRLLAQHPLSIERARLITDLAYPKGSRR